MNRKTVLDHPAVGTLDLLGVQRVGNLRRDEPSSNVWFFEVYLTGGTVLKVKQDELDRDDFVNYWMEARDEIGLTE